MLATSVWRSELKIWRKLGLAPISHHLPVDDIGYSMNISGFQSLYNPSIGSLDSLFDRHPQGFLDHVISLGWVDDTLSPIEP